MKEFEKWFLKSGAKINKYKIAESKAWRAALEWVLEECSLSPTGNRVIREELQDEN